MPDPDLIALFVRPLARLVVRYMISGSVMKGLATLILVFATVTPVLANRADCLRVLGCMAEATLDTYVTEAWDGCPCDWTATAGGRPGAIAARASFKQCVKKAATQAVMGGRLPRKCYAAVAVSARDSTCGRREAVTCCLPHAARGCVVQRPLSSTDSTTACLQHAGAALGHSPSCYDACPPMGKSYCVLDANFDAMMDAATEAAKATLAAAQGKPYDATDAEQNSQLLRQIPKELPCFSGGEATRDYGPSEPD